MKYDIVWNVLSTKHQGWGAGSGEQGGGNGGGGSKETFRLKNVKI